MPNREAAKRWKAERQGRARHPSQPTHRSKQRKPRRPTSPPTKSSRADRTAKRRSEGKPRQRARSGKPQATRGHATRPAQTNRRRATTRTHEPRTQPRGTAEKQQRRPEAEPKPAETTTPPDGAGREGTRPNEQHAQGGTRAGKAGQRARQRKRQHTEGDQPKTKHTTLYVNLLALCGWARDRGRTTRAPGWLLMIFGSFHIRRLDFVGCLHLSAKVETTNILYR